MGKTIQTSNAYNKLQGINLLLTVETMQTNMSPFSDLDMHDRFAEHCRLNDTAVLKSDLCIDCFYSNNVKQNRLKKPNFKKESGKCTINV